MLATEQTAPRCKVLDRSAFQRTDCRMAAVTKRRTAETRRNAIALFARRIQARAPLTVPMRRTASVASSPPCVATAFGNPSLRFFANSLLPYADCSTVRDVPRIRDTTRGSAGVELVPRAVRP